MAVLATAFLQMARVTRVAMSDIDDSNIDTVRTAAINQIGQLLHDDLFDSGGNYFTAGPVLQIPDEAGDESYDYPWTNQDPGELRNEFFVLRMDGVASLPSYGGHLDDTWLASTTPDFPATGNPSWPHITNVDGMFLRIPHIASGFTAPEELAVDHNTGTSGFLQTDTSIEITGSAQAMDDNSNPNFERFGVDADDDGILDSRWCWAPIRQIGAVRYVMAVRIVDQSALLNMNTATALTGDGTNLGTSFVDLPRGYTPSDIDLTRLTWRTSILSPTKWSTDLNGLLLHRGLETPLTAVPGTSQPLAMGLSYNPVTHRFREPLDPLTIPRQRDAAWRDIGRYYGWASVSIGGNLYRRFAVGADVNDELELRYGFGLNNDYLRTTLEDQAPQLLRAEIAANNINDDGDLSTDETEMNYLAVVVDQESYMQGSMGPSLNSKIYDAQRQFLTTLSGAVPYAANHGNMYPNAKSPVLRYDLVTDDGGADAGPAATRAGNIEGIVAAVMKIGAQIYLSTVTPPQIDELAVQFGLAVQDYSDADDTPTSLSLGATTYYGIELMPFLREVYIQVGYEDQDQLMDDGMGNPIAGADGAGDTWVARAGSQAIAVELGNPFDRPILASQLNGRIEIRVVQLGNPVMAWTIAGLSNDIPPRGPQAGLQSKMIIYSNPQNSLDEGGTTYADLAADLTLTGPSTVLEATAPGTLTFNADGNDITVELRVKVSPGVFVAYDRLTVSGFGLPTSPIDHFGPAGADQTIPPANQHGQGSMVRDGQTIRYLSNQGRALVAGSMRMPVSGVASSGYDTTLDRLGADAKGISGDTDLDAFQIPLANRRFLSLAEMGWIFMLGFTNQANGDLPQRFDAMRSAAGASWPRHATLDFDPAAAVPDATGIPHAAMILDQFTILSTHNDGIDNDGDGTSDDADEQLVPGLININTAPLPVAVFGAPLPESVDDIEILMRRIGQYRDDPSPSNRTAITGLSNLHATPGIASIGELMFIRRSGTLGDRDDMQRYGQDGVDNHADPFTWPVDLYPVPEVINDSPAGEKPVQIDATDGAEERMARFQFLSNVYTTRSDLFCAYVLIRGYPAGDFSLGPVEATQFFVIYDRSRVTQSTDSVGVVGVYKIN